MADIAPTKQSFWKTDDAAAILIAFGILFACLVIESIMRRESVPALLQLRNSVVDAIEANPESSASDTSDLQAMKEIDAKLASSWLKPFWLRTSEWTNNPVQSMKDSKSHWMNLPFEVTGITLLFAIGLGKLWQGKQYELLPFSLGFLGLYILATLAFVLASQEVLKYANLEYPLWALLVGLLIANTVGIPEWLRPAVSSELFVKIGLILLGAEVLFGKLLMLGVPGILVSWTVTPIVLITTFWFGQRVLKMESPSLNMVISADMSVCGVSAAIAAGSACRAKKEELSLAIALSLIFTVIMMIAMPYAILWLGLNKVVAGAWLGGTIDSTGAVAAASEILKSSAATEVASTVKMIQNILIGIFAIGIAAYWATYMVPVQEKSNARRKVPWNEVWLRFPKFALGFLAASLIFSILQASGASGNGLVNSVVDGSTKYLRAWFFCLAFVAIGLESDMRRYWSMLRQGKPLTLYLLGQALNITLSFIACYLVFEVLFKNVTEELLR